LLRNHGGSVSFLCSLPEHLIHRSGGPETQGNSDPFIFSIYARFSLACAPPKSVHVTVVDATEWRKTDMNTAVLMDFEKRRRASLEERRARDRAVSQDATGWQAQPVPGFIRASRQPGLAVESVGRARLDSLAAQESEA
jgi:hypothetical protein